MTMKILFVAAPFSLLMGYLTVVNGQRLLATGYVQALQDPPLNPPLCLSVGPLVPVAIAPNIEGVYYIMSVVYFDCLRNLNMTYGN